MTEGTHPVWWSQISQAAALTAAHVEASLELLLLDNWVSSALQVGRPEPLSRAVLVQVYVCDAPAKRWAISFQVLKPAALVFWELGDTLVEVPAVSAQARLLLAEQF